MRNYRAAEGGRPYISVISVNHFVGDAALGVPKQFFNKLAAVLNCCTHKAVFTYY